MDNPSAENSLHLDFNSSLNLDDSKNADAAAPVPATSSEETPAAQSPSSEKGPEAAVSDSRDRKKPYVNPERVKTGGSQRVSGYNSQSSSLLIIQYRTN